MRSAVLLGLAEFLSELLDARDRRARDKRKRSMPDWCEHCGDRIRLVYDEVHYSGCPHADSGGDE